MKDLLPQVGRPAIDNRCMLNAKLWVVRSFFEINNLYNALVLELQLKSFFAVICDTVQLNGGLSVKSVKGTVQK